VGDRIKEKVIITSLEEGPFHILDIQSDIKDRINYRLSTIEKGKEYCVEIENRSTREGSFQGRIELKTTSEKKPVVVINVYGNLREVVMVKPDSISFGTIDTTKRNFERNLTKTVYVSKLRGGGLTVKEVTPSSDWIMTGATVRNEGKQCVITITLDVKRLPKGQFRERLDIKTNSSKKPLVVDVRGEVL